MIEVSLCMIVKNEENILSRCLDSVQGFVDEIIIVDTGSTDKTKEVASKYNAKIYDLEWCDDFGGARNYSFSKATKEYIFWLDADDYIEKDNLNKLIYLKENLDKTIDFVSMEYSLSRDQNGDTTYSLRRNRLVKKEKGFKWFGRIHEYLDVIGQVYHSDVSIYHDKDKPHTNRNLEIFKDMKEKKQIFTERDRFYYANELYYNEEYDEAVKEYNIFINEGKGWVEDLKTATVNLLKCYEYLGKEEEKVEAILKSYTWGKPGADICCKFAEVFMKKGDYNSAIFWYKAAMLGVPAKEHMGIDLKEYYTWVPSIQLCVCYSFIGDYENAHYYNEKTALYIPDSEKVAHNRRFLKEKFKELNLKLPKYNLIKDI